MKIKPAPSLIPTLVRRQPYLQSNMEATASQNDTRLSQRANHKLGFLSIEDLVPHQGELTITLEFDPSEKQVSVEAAHHYWLIPCSKKLQLPISLYVTLKCLFLTPIFLPSCLSFAIVPLSLRMRLCMFPFPRPSYHLQYSPARNTSQLHSKSILLKWNSPPDSTSSIRSKVIHYKAYHSYPLSQPTSYQPVDTPLNAKSSSTVCMLVTSFSQRSTNLSINLCAYRMAPSLGPTKSEATCYVRAKTLTHR